MADISYTFGADTSELLTGLREIDDDLKQMMESLTLLIGTSVSAGGALTKMGEDGDKACKKMGGGAQDAAAIAKQAAGDFDAAFAPIGRAFDTTVNGLLRGTTTWQKAAAQAAQSILTTELEADAKLLARRLATNIGIRASDETTARTSMLTWLLSEQQKTTATTAGTTARRAAETSSSGGFLSRLAQMLAQWLNLEGSKTTATLSGNAARAASDAAAVAAALVPLKAYALSAISTEAAIAGAAAFADSASLGLPGLIAAPGVAAAAVGEVMSFSLLTAKGGAWDLPGDTLLMAHARESVLPAHVAEPMRDFFSGGSGGTGAGRATPDIHLHVHAMDSRGVRQFLLDNHQAVGAAVHKAWRNGGKGLG